MKKVLALLCMLTLGLVSNAWATSYTGSIGYPGTLYATAAWADPSTVLEWVVDNETNTGY